MFYWLERGTKAKGALFVFEPTKEKRDHRDELGLDPMRSLNIVPKSPGPGALSAPHTSNPQAGRQVKLNYGWDGDGRIIAYDPQWYYVPALSCPGGFMLKSEEATVHLKQGAIIMRLNESPVDLFDKEKRVVGFGYGYLIDDKVIFHSYCSDEKPTI